CRRHVGAAIHADAARRPGLPRYPLDGVITVPAFIDEWREVSIRGKTPSNILDEHAVAGRCSLQGIEHHHEAHRSLFSIRSAHEQSRAGLVRRPIQISAQNHAVSSGEFQVSLDDDGWRAIQISSYADEVSLARADLPKDALTSL